LAQVVGFEQVAEVQPGGGISAGGLLERLAVVAGDFEGFVRPPQRWAKHTRSMRSRPAALALGVEGFDDGQEPPPRHDFLHAGEEDFAPGGLLLGGEPGVGEAHLVGHARRLETARLRVCKTPMIPQISALAWFGLMRRLTHAAKLRTWGEAVSKRADLCRDMRAKPSHSAKVNPDSSGGMPHSRQRTRHKPTLPARTAWPAKDSPGACPRDR
jgi:hypothetical protein